MVKESVQDKNGKRWDYQPPKVWCKDGQISGEIPRRRKERFADRDVQGEILITF